MITVSSFWKTWLGSVSFWLLIPHFRTYRVEKIDIRADFFPTVLICLLLVFSKAELFCVFDFFFPLAAESSSEMSRITHQKAQVKLLSPGRIHRLFAMRFQPEFKETGLSVIGEGQCAQLFIGDWLKTPLVSGTVDLVAQKRNYFLRQNAPRTKSALGIWIKRLSRMSYLLCQRLPGRNLKS